jgi:hypothetical protein
VVSGCWPPWYGRPVADAGGRFLPPELCLRQGVPVLVLYGRLPTADHPNPAPLATLGELARRKA